MDKNNCLNNSIETRQGEQLNKTDMPSDDSDENTRQEDQPCSGSINAEVAVKKTTSVHTQKTRVSSRLKELQKQLPKLKALLSSDSGTNLNHNKNVGPYTTPNELPGFFTNNTEFEFLEREPVQRSKSLKSCITPPGTPRTNKVVRFADAMGLDLEKVKHIMNLEDPPLISASKQFQFDSDSMNLNTQLMVTKSLITCFPQPAANVHFVQKVLETKVSLENCISDGEEMAIHGTIRVANVGYHKKVILRYSINSWHSFIDAEADYVPNSSDGATDRFSFYIKLPRYFQTGNKLHFAIMMRVSGKTFWDSNGGRNYIIECFSTL